MSPVRSVTHLSGRSAHFLGAIPTDSPTEIQLDWRLLGQAESDAAGAWTERFSDDAIRAAETVTAWIGEGKLRPRIDRVLPLASAAEAMTAIAQRSVQGRIVLQTGDGR